MMMMSLVFQNVQLTCYVLTTCVDVSIRRTNLPYLRLTDIHLVVTIASAKVMTLVGSGIRKQTVEFTNQYRIKGLTNHNHTPSHLEIRYAAL
jgi:hypothetical protein